MAKYRYAGSGPLDQTAIGQGITRPGDIIDEKDLPGFGPWELLGDEGEAQAGSPSPVPVAEQLAAGVPPEETVTIADQKTGVPPPPIPPAPDTTPES